MKPEKASRTAHRTILRDTIARDAHQQKASGLERQTALRGASLRTKTDKRRQGLLSLLLFQEFPYHNLITCIQTENVPAFRQMSDRQRQDRRSLWQ
jgi:hypothetical protein